MTVLYRPVLIESAEQAEALPRKALVFDNETDGWIQPLIKVGRGDGDWFWMGDDEWDPHPDDLIGWTALVPIEADTEYSTRSAELAWGNDGIYDTREVVRRDGWTDPMCTRYVTPWEETP